MTQEIKVSLLMRHPKNLRKEYRDIDELAASIKAEGVLQNLVVIPDDAIKGQYLVIGGNRRLLAARKAKVETVPCVVRENMTEEEVAKFMLTENMQRNDLTPIEEAYGIQMCIEDYGIKVDDLAKETGLSHTTIRHRLNIAKLDKDILDEVPAQVTLKEYQELEKLKSIEDRNEAAKLLGQAGFSQKVSDLVNKEKIDEWKGECKKTLDKFATKREDGRGLWFVDSWYYYTGKTPEEPKEEGEYFYVESYQGLRLYKTPDEEEEDDDQDEEDEAERERREAERETEREAVFAKYYHRRLDFIKSRKWELSESDVQYHLLKAALQIPRTYGVCKEAWHEIHGEELNEKRDILAPSPTVNQTNIIDWLYCRLEDGQDLDLQTWDDKYQEDHPKATALYSLLDDMGYKQETTETEMLDGTWELYEGGEE
ncbi:MAG: ParB/RepB/Spo0J family partition protein [Firmicutes bacterium]|nr:ParB/RepB/Spo0J family partition protein [Bacillota bacterium]